MKKFFFTIVAGFLLALVSPSSVKAEALIVDGAATYSESGFGDCCDGGGFGFAFDDNYTSYWRLIGAVPDDWGQVQYTATHKFSSYTLYYSGGGGYTFDNFKIQGSNNGVDWTTIDTQTGQYGLDGVNYPIASPACYLYFKLVNDNAPSGAHAFPSELKIYEDASNSCASGGSGSSTPATSTPSLILSLNQVVSSSSESCASVVSGVCVLWLKQSTTTYPVIDFLYLSLVLLVPFILIYLFRKR